VKLRGVLYHVEEIRRQRGRERRGEDERSQGKTRRGGPGGG